MFIKRFSQILLSPRKGRDIIFLFVAVGAMLWQPAYQTQKLNLFEWGLYLPGIDAVCQNHVPFRDFFHLRGPFELYVPALFMKTFGFRADMLSTYFYAGTVLTILAAVLIAWELIELRALLYAFVLVLVTRTFPRVAFTFWGGMRYAWGLLAIWCLVRFLKTKRRAWAFAGGCLAAVGGGTSIDIGVIAGIAFMAALALNREHRRSIGIFFLGVLTISLPYWVYLLSQHALVPYVQAQWMVVTHMQKTFIQLDPVPDTFSKLCHALIFPTDKSFYQMTPVYTYLFFFSLYAGRVFNKKAVALDQAALGVAVYGLILFFTGFRKIGFVEFEMSLQPDKIILFYLWGQLIGWTQQRPDRFKWMGAILLCFVFVSSAVYSAGRFKTRYYKTSWFSALVSKKHQKEKAMINAAPDTLIDLPRLKHMTIPSGQAQDLEELKAFIDNHVPAHEAVWMYPELGSLHFILNRPWVGRFPMVTMSWMDEGWFDDYAAALKANPPRYAIFDKARIDPSYLLVPANRIKHERMVQFLHDHYTLETQTPGYWVYRRIY